MTSVYLLNFKFSFSLCNCSIQGPLATFLFLDLAKPFLCQGFCTAVILEWNMKLLTWSCLIFIPSFLAHLLFPHRALLFFMCWEPLFSVNLSYFFASILFSFAQGNAESVFLFGVYSDAVTAHDNIRHSINIGGENGYVLHNVRSDVSPTYFILC